MSRRIIPIGAGGYPVVPQEFHVTLTLDAQTGHVSFESEVQPTVACVMMARCLAELTAQLAGITQDPPPAPGVAQ